jgi:two-component system NarL family sensor kinase
LVPALDAIAKQQGRLGRFRAEVFVDPAAVGVRDRLLFTISRELLVNVAKHARAEHASVRIARSNGSLVIDVSDDGCGFSEADPMQAVGSGHIGLASVTERVKAVGGDVRIRGAPGGGAHVHVVVPTD